MNEAFWPGTRLTRMTPATHWRVGRSTTFLLTSVPTFLLPPGSGTYLSALLVGPAPQMNAEQILMPWKVSSQWDIQSLRRSLLELHCEWHTHVWMPFWGFSKNHRSKAAQFGPCVFLKTLYCNLMVHSISHEPS